MKTVIIDYNAGNIRSVIFALERLGVEAILSNNPEEIRSADKVIFPGVGEAGSTMRYLRSTKLDQLIPTLKQPVLGICLGMQLLCANSEEGNTKCMGVIPQKVRKFIPQNKEKVPHIGWNIISNKPKTSPYPLFTHLAEAPYVYYVHSYYVETGPYTTALTDYVHPFSAAVQKDNFHATQFHPEKSGTVGAKILKNFLAL